MTEQARQKSIEGYEGLYVVTDDGRVISLNYHKTGRKNLLKASISSDGYLCVVLCKKGSRKNFQVHRLVAKAFCEGYSTELEVCHNDGDKLNNHWANLRWDTRSSNMLDRAKHGVSSKKRASAKRNIGNSRLNEHDVLSIHDEIAKGATKKQLSVKYSICLSQIYNIVNGSSWGWLKSK